MERDSNMTTTVLDPPQIKVRVTEDLSKDLPCLLALLSSTRTRHERDLDLLHHKSGICWEHNSQDITHLTMIP